MCHTAHTQAQPPLELQALLDHHKAVCLPRLGLAWVDCHVHKKLLRFEASPRDCQCWNLLYPLDKQHPERRLLQMAWRSMRPAALIPELALALGPEAPHAVAHCFASPVSAAGGVALLHDQLSWVGGFLWDLLAFDAALVALSDVRRKEVARRELGHLGCLLPPPAATILGGRDVMLRPSAFPVEAAGHIAALTCLWSANNPLAVQPHQFSGSFRQQSQ
mmetsp:Transcript_19060/g.34496  ORF Transcript_19060/g.34496 Transcript_19060/m.34496 type:complete len:219 (-) Transcript_19060:16-672(-)